MGSTKAKWTNGVLTYYDSTTYESDPAGGLLYFVDDFLGPGSTVIPAAGSAESGAMWVKKIVGAAPPTVAQVADQGGGVVACAHTSASEKQDCGLYWGDERGLDVSKGLVIEYRIKASVLPTLLAELVWGVAGDWVDGLDSIVYNAWFTMDGSGEIFCECDDNATDSSVTSGVTLTNADWAVCRIDFSDVTDVKYYINGARVAGSSTIPYAATGANAILQPYVGGYKQSGAGVGTLQIDYVKAWQKRA